MKKNKQKPISFIQAGCDIANAFLTDMKKFFKDNPIPEEMSFVPFYEVFGLKEVFQEITNATYGTLDGKTEDLVYTAELAFFIIQQHVKLGDIHTIDYVKPKKFADGKMGWTSVHC